MSNSSSLSLQDLGDDIFAQILSYLDLSSAIRWKDCIHSSWTLRLTSPYVRHVWEHLFHQQGFSRQDFPQDGSVDTIVRHCKYRTQLQKTLWGTRSSNCFPIPNRLFSFLPILPDDDPEQDWWNDPPPVQFMCDAFMLTSTAVKSEFLLLNPFSHSLSIYSSVLDNAVHSDEGMMEHAIQDAAGCILHLDCSSSSNHEDDSSTNSSAQSTPVHSPPLHSIWMPELEWAAVAFENRVRRNHSLYNRTYHRDPRDILISYQDTLLDVDLMNYFWEQRHQSRFFPNDDDDDELQIEIAYMGIDAKPVLRINGEPTGTTMLSVGRALYTERNNDQVLECFETMSWFRDANNNKSQWICRARGDFQWVELCANRKWVYFNPSLPNGDHLIREWNQPLGDSKVLVYPMMEYRPEDTHVDPSRYFPAAQFILECQNRVSSLGVCALGLYLIVATLPSRLIVWNMQMTTPTVVQEIVLDRVLKHTLGNRLAAEAPIQSIHCPKGVSLEERGFCTLQKSRTHGSIILLWHHAMIPECGKREFQLHTMIHLPLSAQRTPQIHYDGRRLIVFGQDHISLIILVYEVIIRMDHPAHQEEHRSGEQLDGGVFDLSAPRTSPRVRFVNRIRHAALGGIEDYESLRMTCNERFVVVNTKTGNLLSDGAIPFHEGLLVIDLDDHQHRSS